MTKPSTIRNRLAHVFGSIEVVSIYLTSFIPLNVLRRLVLRAWGAKVGDGVALHHGLQVRSARHLVIGDDCYIAEDVVLDARGSLSIGSHTSVNSGAQIWTAAHDITSPVFAYVAAPVQIGSRCWVSARAIVLAGVSLGDGAVLAAGAVATKDIAPWTLNGGNPARLIKGRPIVDEYKLDAARHKVWWW